jgi:RNA polymerase sigma-70 factor (ECF subfamily)
VSTLHRQVRLRSSDWVSWARPQTESPLDDAAVVARAQRDPRAFAPLYERYFEAIYRYTYRRLSSHEAAEDATSIVFHRALERLTQFRGGSFRAWLFTIAHNVVTDTYRERRPTQSFDDAQIDPVDPDATPEETALARELGRSLHEVLAQIAPDQRRVLELRLAGLTGRENSHGAVGGARLAPINSHWRPSLCCSAQSRWSPWCRPSSATRSSQRSTRPCRWSR